jgi:hypothetical protein
MHRQKGAKTSVDHPFLLLIGKLWYKRTNPAGGETTLKFSSFVLMFVFFEKISKTV